MHTVLFIYYIILYREITGMALHYICIEDLGNFLMCHSRGGGEQQTRTNAPSFMVKKICRTHFLYVNRFYCGLPPGLPLLIGVSRHHRPSG